MTSTAADILMDSLQDWGVKVIFGFPGDGINGLWRHYAGARKTSALFRSDTRKRRLSWPAAMQNIPAN